MMGLVPDSREPVSAHTEPAFYFNGGCMAKTKLTYTIKGERKRSEVFRSASEAQEHLVKLQQLFTVVSSELKEI